MLLGLGADFLDSYFINYAYARARRFERWDVKCSVHEAVRGVGIANGPRLECEWLFVRMPSSKSGFEFGCKIGAHIEVSDAGPPAKPLQHAARGEISVQRLHVDRNSSERLKGIQHHMRSDAMRFFDDGFHVLDIGAAKDDMRNGDEKRLFVDGIDQALGWHVNAVIGA